MLGNGINAPRESIPICLIKFLLDGIVFLILGVWSEICI